MKIEDLFLKPVERPIEGVIKADDQRHLLTEVEEFVITKEVGKGLDQFVERYLEETTANGVWISGFFGSGKSHLLKILSLLLDNQLLANGQHPRDIMLPKIEDEILRDNLIKAARIPARSILFNIDQKADHIGGDTSAPILEVFVKVLNELRGYHGKQGHIAKFEHDLDKAGQLAAFKETYIRVNGRPWEQDRDALATVRKKAFAAAYAEHFSVSEQEGFDVLAKLRDGYRLDIQTFAEQVREYIDSQGKDFRLNFFVDEVGQFIGQNSKSMLNLQTVAETLATVCDGRAWVFVTSQADLRGILGDLENAQANEFSKIEARFKTRVNLTAADVLEVIGQRLLAKSEPEPEALTAVYDPEKDNLATLFRFGDESLQFKPWRGSDEFCALYLHRYTRDTVNTLLNSYLREFLHKIEARINHLAHVEATTTSAREKTAARKEADKLRKALKECQEWEREVVLPLAQQRIELDLDDGVKANYQKFPGLLAKIAGFDKKEEES